MELVSACASLDKSSVDEIIFMLRIFSLVSSHVTRWKRK